MKHMKNIELMECLINSFEIDWNSAVLHMFDLVLLLLLFVAITANFQSVGAVRKWFPCVSLPLALLNAKHFFHFIY